MQTLGFKLDRKSLVSVLTLAGRVIERRNTIPILGHVLFDVARDLVTVSGTDLDIEIRQDMPADTSGAGRLCVEHSALLAAVKKMTGEFVRIADVGDKRATVTDCTSGAVMRVPTLPADDYPVFLRTGGNDATKTLPDGFTMPTESLRDALQDCAIAMSTEETRYYLQGIFMHVTREESNVRDVLRFAATDGHRLVRVTRPVPDGLEPAALPDVIIPRKTIGLLGKLFGTKKPERDDVRLQIAAARIAVSYGRTTIYSKTIDGTFPDYQRVIPYSNNFRLTVAADAFSDAVAGAAAIASEKTRAVTLSIDPAEPLIIACTSPENGTAATIVEDATIVSEPFAIGFNAAYLTQILGMLGGTVTVELADAAAPTAFRSDAKPDTFTVLMPMRTGGGLTTRDAVAMLNATVWERFKAEAPDLVASLERLPDGKDHRTTRKAARFAVGQRIGAAVDYLVQCGIERQRARYLAKQEMAYAAGDTAAADRALAIATRLEQPVTGSFSALQGASTLQELQIAPVDMPAATAEPTPVVPADADDLREASDGFTCSGCGRAEFDCSVDPCDDVIADREEAEADEADEMDPADAIEPVADPEPVVSLGSPAGPIVDVVKLLTLTEQAVWVSRAEWSNPAQSVMQRYHRDGTQFGERVVLRSNIAREVLPRGGADKPLKRAEPAVEAAPVTAAADPALEARLERLERIVAGQAQPAEDAGRIAALEAELAETRAQLADMTERHATLWRRRGCARRLARAGVRMRAQRAELRSERDAAVSKASVLQVRADALERLHANSATLDTAAPVNGSAKPAVVLVERVGNGPRG